MLNQTIMQSTGNTTIFTLKAKKDVIFLASYRTNVVAIDTKLNQALVTSQKYSRTTSKHINQFLRKFKGLEITQVTQETLDNFSGVSIK